MPKQAAQAVCLGRPGLEPHLAKIGDQAGAA
jgi:hypothetical protein